MKILGKLDKIWSSMRSILEIIIASINERTIIPAIGGGIDTQESENGVLIALSSTGVLNKKGGGASTTDLTALTARVAALEAILAGSSWQSVDVMSPACVRSTINVLEK